MLPSAMESLAASHWRHLHLIAAASAAIDFLAGAELEILVPADPHLAQPLAVAGHGDRGGAQAGIDLDESVLDLRRRNGLRLRKLKIFRRDFDGGTRLADGLEIGPRRKPRACAVLVPFVENQSRRRHQI